MTKDNVRDARNYRKRHPERLKLLNSKRITFKGKTIRIGFCPRKGQCSKCGVIGPTHMHHDKYDEKNPVAHTRELCPSCHRKEHSK